MSGRGLFWLAMVFSLLFATATACAPADPDSLPPAQASALSDDLRSAWGADFYGVWDVDWSDAPLAGSLIVAVWHYQDQRRYEILESETPGWVGQTYVSDGQTATLSHRFRPAEPPHTTPADAARFDPIGGAFSQIANLLQQEPLAIIPLRRPAEAPHQLELHYADQSHLRVWFDPAAQHILKVVLYPPAATQPSLLLTARQLQPLNHVHPALFSHQPPP